MPTELNHSEEFPASPAAVFSAITNEEFLTARMAAGGGVEPKVVSIETAGAATTVVTQQSIPAELLPSMVASMLGGDPVTERTEVWQADGDGYSAEFSLVVKGAPASVKGAMTLAPNGSGSVLSVTGAANVPIPMFGAKLEDTIVEQISSVLTAEGTYTREHVA